MFRVQTMKKTFIQFQCQLQIRYSFSFTGWHPLQRVGTLARRPISAPAGLELTVVDVERPDLYV